MNASAFFLACLVGVVATDAQVLKLVQTIPLPSVEGRIDHASLDAVGGRLFVPALGNNTVEVVDLKAGKVVRSLSGFSEPQGLLYLAEFNRLYVANGGDGALRILDGTTFAAVAAIKFDDDADNVRYDAAAKQVYVGYGNGALGIVDAEKNALVGTIPLSAHPESFQLEKSGSRIFVNVPHSHVVAVVDRSSRKLLGTWALGLVAANFPMALDDVNHRAFIACRLPARLLVFDTGSGHEIGKLDLHGDCDDVFYDAKRHQIYASCGEGFIDVFSQTDADHYALKAAVKTVGKARTSFFADHRIYLAVPRQGSAEAAIRVYEVQADGR
jgi:DNA-binding beta-propeller fold protein YncE